MARHLDAGVVVVGAGPAGALVADYLARDGHDVVVLDAGPVHDDSTGPTRTERMERHIRPGYDGESVWGMGGPRDAFVSSGEAFYPLNATRVKGIGGSTLHWQGMVMRLHEADFERQTRDGYGTDWPVSYADLAPYYTDAERELGVAGALDNPFAPPRDGPFPLPAFPPSYSDSLFAPACERLGLATHSVPNARNSEPYDGRSPCVGYGTCTPVCPSGAKYTAETHVDRASAAGATVVANAPVSRLETDATGGRVERAVVVREGREHTVEADRFVLCTGGVETPRLLLLSASDAHPDGLANSSGAVGRYFMDHLFAGVGGRLDEPTRQNHVGFITTESHQFYDDPGQSTSGTDGGIPASDADLGPFKLEFLNYAGPSPVGVALSGDDWGDALLDDIRDAYGTHLAMGALVEQPPLPDNRITLDHSRTDDRGDPVPDVTWRVDSRARRTIERANEVQRAVMEELGVDVDWVVGPDETGPAAHHMGTTRMGDDPDESVVGPNLRTHDVENLWIASSSVFPTGGAMNPTLTIAALALRCAESVARA